MELDDRVFDRALLRESMHAKELLEEFIAGINFEEAMRGFVGVLPSTQVLYIEMPYIEITFNLGPVQDEHGNEQAPAQT